MKYVFAFVSMGLLFGCTEERVDRSAAPEVIRLAVLPDQSKERLVTKNALLLAYLERETSLQFSLTIPKDYSDLLVQFDDGRIDLAWFGGLTFTQAEQASDARPLVFRDVDTRFTSCYLASAADSRTAIDAFEGASFSFGPELSTSGHLMPRFYMMEAGIDPEQIFASIRYSPGHDQTAIWVRDGAVALGVANCVIVQSLFESGVLDNGKVHVIETTPPYSDYVWAVTASMDEDTRLLLLDAFLALDATNAEHRAVLLSQGANVYLPAANSDFDAVRLAAIQAGVLVDNGNK